MTEAPAQPRPAEAGEAPPRLADGVELLGRYEDSGFKEAPFMVRRADGQMVQLPALLYALAERADGSRSWEEIGAELTEIGERELRADDVRLLAEEGLRPLGLLTAPDGSSPKVEKIDPLLALSWRKAVVPERAVNALTTIFRPLFLPPVVLAVVAGFLAFDGWLFFVHGVGQPLRALLYQPALLVALLAAVVLATAFHEVGHATGCRYGGARPGPLGVGLYVIWPVFYSEVTDSYRLDRKGRLRTDLGGVYFNAIVVLLTAGAYAATGFEPILVLSMVQTFAILQQLLPLGRLDGYLVLTDLTGVPDMLSRMKPVLASLIPGRERDPRVEELKPWVRVVTSGYLALLAPVLLLIFALMLLHAPRLFATAWDSFGVHWDDLSAAASDGRLLDVGGNAIQVLALVLPSLGIAATTVRVGRRAGAGLIGWSAGEPLRQAVALGGATAVAGLAAFTWWPNGEYRPIQPGERGTFGGAVSSFADVPSGRPSLTEERLRSLDGAPTERELRREEAPAEEAPAPREESREEPAATTPEEEPASTAPEATEPTGTAPTTTEPTQTAPQAQPAPTTTTPTQTTPTP